MSVKTNLRIIKNTFSRVVVHKKTHDIYGNLEKVYLTVYNYNQPINLEVDNNSIYCGTTPIDITELKENYSFKIGRV